MTLEVIWILLVVQAVLIQKNAGWRKDPLLWTRYQRESDGRWGILEDLSFNCGSGIEDAQIAPLRLYDDPDYAIDWRKSEIFFKIKELLPTITSDDMIACWSPEPGRKSFSSSISAITVVVNCSDPTFHANTDHSYLRKIRNVRVVLFIDCFLSSTAIESFSGIFSLHFLVVRGASIEELNPTTTLNGPYFENLMWLELSRSGIVRISAWFLCSTRNLTLLDLSQNNLTDDGFLDGWESTEDCKMTALLWLDLSANQIMTISEKFLHILPNLEVIILSGNLIKSAENIRFVLPRIQIIDLTNNKLVNFDFHFIPAHVEVLILKRNNELQFVTDKYRKSKNFNFKALDLSRNHLKLLNFHINCCSMTMVDLRSTIVNNIMIMEGDTDESFRIIDDMYTFATTRTKIKAAYIHKFQMSNYWQYLKNLNVSECFCETSHLCSNTLKLLDDYRLERTLIIYCFCDYFVGNICRNDSFHGSVYAAIYPMHNDAALYGYGNDKRLIADKLLEIVEKPLPLYYFTGNTELDNSNKNISYLRDSVFEDCGDIYVLDLSNNQLREVRGPEFKGLTNLTKLILTNNKITIIAPRGFSQIPHMEVLSLAQNILVSLFNDTFCGLKYLLRLALNENKLEHIDPGTFDCVKSLKTLKLHDNLLRVIYWEKLPQHLEIMSLRNNCFPCDCNFLKPFREHLSGSKILVLDSNETQCQHLNGERVPLPIFEFTDQECYLLFAVDELLFWGILCAGLFFAISIVAIIFLFIYRYEVKVWCFTRFGAQFRISFKKVPAEDSETLFDAYVSYNTADEEFVANVLVKEIEKKHYRLCIQERNFLAGVSIAETVAQVIENSHRTIVVLSPDFARNNHCKYEFKLAHDDALKQGNKKLIVVLLKDVDDKDLDVEMRSYLRTNTYLRWGCKMFWQKLYYAMPRTPLGHQADDTTV